MKQRNTEEQFYETVTAYQQIEALGNAARILEGWTDLQPLAKTLRDAQRNLYKSVSYTDGTHGTC